MHYVAFEFYSIKLEKEKGDKLGSVVGVYICLYIVTNIRILYNRRTVKYFKSKLRGARRGLRIVRNLETEFVLQWRSQTGV